MNHVYPKALEAMLQGDVDVVGGTVKVVAVSAAYVYSTGHEHLDDVDADARLATATLTVTGVTGGRVDADDFTLSSVPTGDTLTGLIVYQDTGSEATSTLLAYIDRKADTVPISVGTNDGDINVTWLGGRVFSI